MDSIAILNAILDKVLAEGKAFILLCGIPVSDKTVTAERIVLEHDDVDISILHPENFRISITGNRKDFSKEREVRSAVYNAIETKLEEGGSVILDGTNLSDANRAIMCKIARRHGNSVGCLVFKPNLFESMTRINALEADIDYDIMEKSLIKFKNNQPTVDEGFDYIVQIV